MKKIKSVIITILLFGMIISSLNAQDVLAGGSWKTAYSKFLSNPNSKVHGTKIADYDGKLKFEIKDLNADGIPELICDTSWIGGYNCPVVLYTFKNGKIKCAGKAGHAGVFYRFKNSSLFKLEEQTWGSAFFEYHSYYKLVNGKMKLIASHVRDGGDDNMGNKNTYEIRGKKCSKTKFKDFLKKNECTGKKIRVGSKYTVTPENIKKAINKAMVE